MFKARHTDTHQDIVILDQMGEGKLAGLRQAGRDGRLICPWCDLPVLPKVGEIRHPHFAHRNANPKCPVSTDPLFLLEARAMLYRWLQTKFEGRGGHVEVERHMPDLRLPRPLDCWVETDKGRKFG